jgi:hypothetical protein
MFEVASAIPVKNDCALTHLPFKGVTRLFKSLIRIFKGLIRPLKAL